MAKSSLTFSERRDVKVLTQGGVRKLVSHDSGRVFVLSGLQGHAITLPTAGEAGNGWNCRFIVGAVQNDASIRDNTTIVAQGTEVVSALVPKTGGSLGSAVAATTDDILDTAGIAARFDVSQAELTKENFTITVPVGAGGSGTTFTFKLLTLDASLTGGAGAQDADTGKVAAAGEFEISLENFAGNNAAQDGILAAQIIACINGAATVAGVRVPASGDGATGTGIKRLTAAAGSNGTTEIDLAAALAGAAGDTIAIAYDGLEHGEVNAKIIGNALGDPGSRTLGGTVAGANATGIAAAGQTITISAGATLGDQIELCVANGQWFVKSYRAA